MSISPLRRLTRFAEALSSEGFETALAEAGVGVPYDTLLVAVGDPEAGEWRLELSFIPGMEEQLAGVAILQCFATVALDVDSSRRDDLRELVGRLNPRLPLMGFAYLERERLVCFRHTLLLPDGEGAGVLVTQATWLTSYLLSTFGHAISRLATGEATVDETLAATPFADVLT